MLFIKKFYYKNSYKNRSTNKNNYFNKYCFRIEKITCINFLWSLPTIITLFLVIFMSILDAKNQPEMLNIFVSKYEQKIIYIHDSTLTTTTINNNNSPEILYYRTCPIYEYKHKLYDCISVVNCCKSTHSLNQSYFCAEQEFPLYSYRTAYISPDGFCSFTYSHSQYFVGLWLCLSFFILTLLTTIIIKSYYEINNSSNTNNVVVEDILVKNKKHTIKTKSDYVQLKEEEDDNFIL